MRRLALVACLGILLNLVGCYVPISQKEQTWAKPFLGTWKTTQRVYFAEPEKPPPFTEGFIFRERREIWFRSRQTLELRPGSDLVINDVVKIISKPGEQQILVGTLHLGGSKRTFALALTQEQGISTDGKITWASKVYDAMVN